MQILEGEYSKIIFLFEKIKIDKRHKNIIEVFNSPIAKKSFNQFGLGYEVINDIEKFYSLQEYLGLLPQQKNTLTHFNLIRIIIEKFLSVNI